MTQQELDVLCGQETARSFYATLEALEKTGSLLSEVYKALKPGVLKTLNSRTPRELAGNLKPLAEEAVRSPMNLVGAGRLADASSISERMLSRGQNDLVRRAKPLLSDLPPF